VLVFAAPAAEAGMAPDLLTVIVRPEDAGTRVLGVYALDRPPAAVAEAWDGLELRPSALDLDLTSAARSRIRLSSGATAAALAPLVEPAAGAAR
jgi:hypothetical protein